MLILFISREDAEETKGKKLKHFSFNLQSKCTFKLYILIVHFLFLIYSL